MATLALAKVIWMNEMHFCFYQEKSEGQARRSFCLFPSVPSSFNICQRAVSEQDHRGNVPHQVLSSWRLISQ